MFERFSEGAREVVVQAQHEADLLGHNYIGTEHLLLGLASDAGPSGRALRTLGLTAEMLRAQTKTFVGEPAMSDADALAAIGIDLDEVRRRVEAEFGPGALDGPRRSRSSRRRRRRSCGGEKCVTCRAKKALQLSHDQAVSRGDGYIASEHVLLGILEVDDGLAVRLLENLGHTPERVRSELLRELSSS